MNNPKLPERSLNWLLKEVDKQGNHNLIPIHIVKNIDDIYYFSS